MKILNTIQAKTSLLPCSSIITRHRHRLKAVHFVQTTHKHMQLCRTLGGPLQKLGFVFHSLLNHSRKDMLSLLSVMTEHCAVERQANIYWNYHCTIAVVVSTYFEAEKTVFYFFCKCSTRAIRR